VGTKKTAFQTMKIWVHQKLFIYNGWEYGGKNIIKVV